MPSQFPFVHLKAEFVKNSKQQVLFPSQRPWTGIMVKDSEGHLRLVPDALVDTGSSVTTLPVSIADCKSISRPAEHDEDAKTRISGSTGQSFAWIGPAEIAFPALGLDKTYRIQCCFNPHCKYPILGAKEIFSHFRLLPGVHPESGESGYVLVPIQD